MVSEAAVVRGLRAAGLLVIGYYGIVTIHYLGLHAIALVGLWRREANAGPPSADGLDAVDPPGVALVVPAYNEEDAILESLSSLLSLEYPDVEVVVVNDGSTDATLDLLREAYDLVPADIAISGDISTEPIRGAYRSRSVEDLLVVDKRNGGKADALNAGVGAADKPLFCAVDADTVLESAALSRLVEPFLVDPDTVAAGGTVRVANGCRFEAGSLVSVGLPAVRLASIQAMEYLRAFYMGRYGLARIRALILISGAFGVFRTDAVRGIDGYRRDTVSEDFDLVVRLHRHFNDVGGDYQVAFVPEAVAWTEAPVTLRGLSRQRRRWTRGMIETLVAYRDMIGNPRYGRVGLYALPYFVLVELGAPLVEGLGYLLFLPSYALGAIDLVYLIAFFLLAVGVGSLVSGFALVGELLLPGGHDDPRQMATLIVDTVAENLGYRQWQTAVAWRALLEFLLGVDRWGRAERHGIDVD